MKAGDFSASDTGIEATIVQRVIIVAIILLVGLFMGSLAAKGYKLPIALIGGFIMMVLLLARPYYFLMAGIFFFYQALDIVETDTFGRVAGLFRLKDIFLVLIVGNTIAAQIVGGGVDILPRRSAVLYPFLLFMAWIAFEMWYTVVITKEKPLLMFRVARHFLTYGLICFVPWYLRSDKHWDRMFLFMHGLAAATLCLGLVKAIAPTLPIFALRGRYGGSGVLKFWNPGESIVYSMFIFNAWRFCHQPSRKHVILTTIMAMGCCMFIFRARLAGIFLGMVVSFFLAAPRVRARAISIGVPVIVTILIFLIAFSAIAPARSAGGDTYVDKVIGHFQEAVDGLIHKDTESIIVREYIMLERLPLVRQHPWVGIGFVSPFGAIAWRMFRTGTMPLGHNDVGWLDILMRLGSIGAVLITVLLVSAAIEARRLLRSPSLNVRERAACLTMVTYIVLMFVSTYSFSYPSIEPPIVTFTVFLSYLIYIRRKYEKKEGADEKDDDAESRTGEDPSGRALVPRIRV